MSDLPEGFHALMQRLDDIALEKCPDSTPYASQYRVIEMLRKMQTTNLSSTEHATVAAKLGATLLAVEEPHHAQTALEAAGQVFFPTLVQFTTQITSDDGSHDLVVANLVPKVLHEMPPVLVTTAHDAYRVYIVELLTQLGVLWYNRSRLLRALCYLSTGQTLCTEDAKTHEDPTLGTAETYVHFYLAQVYGKLGLASESATCCLSTLELQLWHYVNATRPLPWTGAFDWVRNALKLVEVYFDADEVQHVATCLKASEYVLRQHECDLSVDKQMLVAEIYVKWSRVHETTLRLAARAKAGHSMDNLSPTLLPRPRTLETTLLTVRQTLSSTPAGVPMEFVPPARITTYAHARTVFQMGLCACRRARQVFVLDGYVTPHVRLLQRESALYRHLVPFEDVHKRRVAMHRRRVALLTPLLNDTLNQQVYCPLLQELYFECAEIYVDLFELNQSTASTAKRVTYAIKAVQCYQHFLLLYYPSSSSATHEARRDAVLRGGTDVTLPPGQTFSPREFRTLLLGYVGLAHLCSKLSFPRDLAKTVGYWRQGLAYYEAVTALVGQYQATYSETQGHDLRHRLQAELAICREMVQLLPAKINQLVYNGRVVLS